MDEEKTNEENEGAKESAPAEESSAPAEESTAPAAEETAAPVAEETATAEAPPEQETAHATAAPADDDGGDGSRPTFLTVLCILTFIGSGLGVLTNLTLAVGVDALANMMGGFGGALGGGTAYFAVGTVLAAASLFGALQMWKLKKMGFYLYVAANIIAAVLPMVWLGAAFGAMGLVVPIVFIVLYGLNLKHMS